jgi:hypothetical protein
LGTGKNKRSDGSRNPASCEKGTPSGSFMTDAPETHYTRSADGTNLAYQLSGHGPLALCS